MGGADRPAAVVTGASKGIGRALAEDLAGRGFDLLLAARSGDALGELAARVGAEHGVAAHPLPCDLSRDEGVHAVGDAVDRLGLDVHLLANNAGFGQFGPYLELDADAERDQLMLNVVALTRLTRALLPPMVERGSGRVLNVASTAAFYPGPLMSVYYASKAYVLSYSLGLAEELEGTGVTVTCLCPGPTRTRFHERAGMEASGLFTFQAVMDAKEVARQGVDATLEGERVRIPGITNRVSAFASRLAPRRLAARLVRRIQQER